MSYFLFLCLHLHKTMANLAGFFGKIEHNVGERFHNEGDSGIKRL